MSTDRTRFIAQCDECGKTGVSISASDDWNRSWTEWEGFDTEPVDPYLVERKREEPMRPVCSCGSRKITVSNTPA